jgi:hypothetical protein
MSLQHEVAGGGTPEALGARGAQGTGTQLKSERVQLELQVVPSARQEQAALGEGSLTLTLATLCLTFEAPAPAGASGEEAGSAANDEAGSACGAPGHDDQPSTYGKEADHAESEDVR